MMRANRFKTGILPLFVVFVLSLVGVIDVSADVANSSGIAYTITDLGDLGGGYSYASGINDSGQVTGVASTSADYLHAFLYRTGAMTDLGTLGGDYVQGNGINKSGQVTGFSQTSAGYDHAFIYSDGTLVDLGTLGGNFSQGNGINNSGKVTGFAQISSGADHIFLYGNGVMTDLGTLGGNQGRGYDINNSDQVTGYVRTGDGGEHAFLYSNGTMTDLGTLGGKQSIGYAINDAGQVTGHSYTGTGYSHAFRYSGGVMTDLGDLGGGESWGYGINNSGQVVGMSYTGDGDEHAFLYNNGTMLDLNTLIPADSGWVLYEATGINISGQISGYGINASGYTHAFLLSPSPASSVILTPGIASPVSVGTPVTFTAVASGGSGSYQYKYLLKAPGGTLTTVRDYASTATWNWTTTGLAAGTYQVVVHARNAGSTKSYETYKSITYALANPASAVTLTPGVASPVSVGTPVTFTAVASGGSGSYQYKYLLKAPGGTLTTVRDYASTATWNWTTTGLAAGTYQVVVHARNAGSTKSYETYKSITYALANPASAVTLTPGVASPVSVGTPVTFTAVASGGSGSYQYKYLLKAPGGTLTTVRDYASTATWNWTTTGLAAGTYQVVVHARNAGSTKSYETYKSISYALK
jgi:probable HAF family extracellular repeat protein